MLEARVAPYEPTDLELGGDRPAPVAPRVPAEEKEPLDLGPRERRAERRRSSGLLQQAVQELQPAPVVPQRDARDDDQKLVGELIEVIAKLGARTSSAVRLPLHQWRAEHFRGVADDAFYERVLTILLYEDAEMRRSFDARKGMMRGMVLVKNVILLGLENVYDAGLCVGFWQLGQDHYFYGLFSILVASGTAQALSAYFYTREGPRVAVMSQFGLKVFVEAWRAHYRLRPRENSR